MSELRSTSEWCLTGTQNNATNTLTQTGVATKTHYCTGIGVSANNTVTALLCQVKDGSTVLYQFYLTNTASSLYPMDVRFDIPIHATKGADLVFTVAASGTGGTITAANMSGFSVNG